MGRRGEAGEGPGRAERGGGEREWRGGVHGLGKGGGSYKDKGRIERLYEGKMVQEANRQYGKLE